MVDDYQRRYAAILGSMVGSLRSPWGARIRWVRDQDDGDNGSAYLLCIAIGARTFDETGELEPPEVIGCLFYADGRQQGPDPVLPEHRDALLEGVGISV